MMTVYKEPGSPTYVPQDFHRLPTDDLTDAQKEKERQEDEERRAAIAIQKKAKAAMRKRAIKKSPKRPPRKSSPDEIQRTAMGKSEKKMCLAYDEKDRNKPRVLCVPIGFLQNMTRDRGRKGNLARR